MFLLLRVRRSRTYIAKAKELFPERKKFKNHQLSIACTHFFNKQAVSNFHLLLSRIEEIAQPQIVMLGDTHIFLLTRVSLEARQNHKKRNSRMDRITFGGMIAFGAG
jgi:hypothetical protein